MPHLNQRARRALAQLRLIEADASSPQRFAVRALDAVRSAVPFDLGAVFSVDGESLLLTGVLARFGHSDAELRDWVRDVYLVVGEPDSMSFPTLLGRGGGVGAYHPDADRWLRVVPEAETAAGLAPAWRSTNTPPGGFLRYGLAHRRRWVGALQLARLEPGSGFRSSELEFLDRAAPSLGRALAVRLASAGRDGSAPRLGAGRLLFDDRRRAVSVSATGLTWMSRLDPSTAGPDGMGIVPVAAQSLVSHLAGSGHSEARVSTVDVHGKPVTIGGERLIHHAAGTTQPVLGYCLTVAAAPAFGTGSTSSLTDGQWRVARAVACGLTDREIARQLGIATTTVHERVQRLHELLDTHSRAQLVACLHLIEHDTWPGRR